MTTSEYRQHLWNIFKGRFEDSWGKRSSVQTKWSREKGRSYLYLPFKIRSVTIYPSPHSLSLSHRSFLNIRLVSVSLLAHLWTQMRKRNRSRQFINEMVISYVFRSWLWSQWNTGVGQLLGPNVGTQKSCVIHTPPQGSTHMLIPKFIQKRQDIPWANRCPRQSKMTCMIRHKQWSCWHTWVLLLLLPLSSFVTWSKIFMDFSTPWHCLWNRK